VRWSDCPLRFTVPGRAQQISRGGSIVTGGGWNYSICGDHVMHAGKHFCQFCWLTGGPFGALSIGVMCSDSPPLVHVRADWLASRDEGGWMYCSAGHACTVVDLFSYAVPLAIHMMSYGEASAISRLARSYGCFWTSTTEAWRCISTVFALASCFPLGCAAHSAGEQSFLGPWTQFK